MSTRDSDAVRVLIVDDDRKLCRLLADYLGPFGYDVTSAYTGPTGLDLAIHGGFDAVILDLMLPGMDGFEVLKRLRRESTVPVLMLTARGDETDRIVGLEIGADDYLPKTFSTRELLARLRAVTRRASMPAAGVGGGSSGGAEPLAEQPVVIGDLRIEPAARRVVQADAIVELTPIEFDLLLSLARAAGRVLSREQLLGGVAGRDYEVFDRSIDVHVSSLRRKLDDDARQPRYIKTVRAAGYMFITDLVE